MLKGARIRGYEVPVYDDGFGRLWVLRDSMGVRGVVRAETFSTAWEICEDEFLPEAEETVDELRKEYGFRRRHVKVVRGPDGVEREARAEDYSGPGGTLQGVEFVRWDVEETPDPEAWPENELFQEAYGFRPSGPNTKDKIGHGIYAKDLNGEVLEEITEELKESLDLTLEFDRDEGKND